MSWGGWAAPGPRGTLPAGEPLETRAGPASILNHRLKPELDRIPSLLGGGQG